MAFDDFIGNFPDTDANETREWLESLDGVIAERGTTRASYIMSRLVAHARQRGMTVPAAVYTPYVNTIPAGQQPWFPGDEAIERRIRAFTRWNAAVMVIRANMTADGIGGHLSTYASSAALYEVGFNHFFHGKDGGRPGDHIYIQGHAAPGIYARAYLEGRLDETQLDGFRQEFSKDGLPSYPHPRLMPEFWEYPTVSMGLGPLNAIYQARFNRYLENREIDDTGDSRVWCFVGDGEMDEPEAHGALSIASRQELDNLTFVVNCNLQRLDGPVRGNGKIIQELEALFRGAGWNVIKVVWGSRWDELFAGDVDGVLIKKLNATPDGEFQTLTTKSGSYIREYFFGTDPRLRQLVSHLSDEELRWLPRGGHDYRKLYAAYKSAVEHRGNPTVVLAHTIKGWALGASLEARNATHQIKKMTKAQLLEMRDRLYLHDEIPDEALDAKLPPYYRPDADSEIIQYMMQRRRELGGLLPSRGLPIRRPLKLPSDDAFKEFWGGSGKRPVATTQAFIRMLRNLMREPEFGSRVVPIVPDEARTFGMDSFFKEFGIYAPHGQTYEPVDADLILAYIERSDGQLLEEGLTEAGAMASFTAAGSSYSTRGVPMAPFYIFYSMFGFQRVGDLVWSFADMRGRGFLLGATAGRTTLSGEGLQHNDGHSHVLFSVVPNCKAYDPAFAYEIAAIIRDGINRMYGDGEDIFYYITLYNEPYAMPPMPEGVSEAEICAGMYRFAAAPDGGADTATILFSGSAHAAAHKAQEMLIGDYDIAAELWSVTSFKNLREDALTKERWNRLHPLAEPRTPYVTERLAHSRGPIVAVTDFMKAVPDQVSRWVPRPFVSLGTDGFGRSDTRAAAREFFEIDAPHIVVATLAALVDDCRLDPDVVVGAISDLGIDADAVDPRDSV